MSEQIGTILIQYGLAGVVIYIFYRLITNELRDLKESIERLKQSIDELIIQIKTMKQSNNR